MISIRRLMSWFCVLLCCTLSQKPFIWTWYGVTQTDEVLQTYNTRYSAYFGLAYPELDLDDPMTKMHCTNYAMSPYGKFGDEMTGRFNQELPRDLTEAFRKAVNFEPRIITKQSINDRKMHEVNHVDIGNYSEDIEVNEAHVRNPNYKGKNYDPNYQQNRYKQNANTSISSTGNNYRNSNNQGNSFSNLTLKITIPATKEITPR